MKNQAHVAFKKENAKFENGNWIIPETKTRILYDGRYCAVAGFVFAIIDGKYSVLANVRGPGCPDFCGFWNCPCGYLERDEDGEEGIRRELREETGVFISPGILKFTEAQTDPWTSNNGNVTLRYVVRNLGFHKSTNFKFSQNGGEEGEVSKVAWIPVSDVNSYNWAFGHGELIRKYAYPRFIQWVLEKLYLII